MNRREAVRAHARLVRSGDPRRVCRELARYELPGGLVGIVAVDWKPSDDGATALRLGECERGK